MNRKMILLPIVVLVLASLACSVNINLPSTNVKTGPTVTDQINVPLPEDSQDTSNVAVNFGAGTLTLKPGAENALIDGTATYNVPDFKPVVTVEGDDVIVGQGELDLGGFSSFNRNITNDWVLSLGNHPINLHIKAGAYQGDYELGGLSIQRLNIADGAAQADLSFSAPNLVPMSSLEYTTGASDVSLEGLANANTTDMTFRGGAGTYTLDFSGELQEDMYVNLEAGVSTVTIIVPQGVNAVVNADTGLMTISTSGSWEQQGNSYQMSGDGNTITIKVTMGAGTLRLETGQTKNK